MTKRPFHVPKAIHAAFLATMALSLTPAVAHADFANADSPSPFFSSSSALPDGEKRYIVKYGNHVNAEAESESLEQRGIDVKETLSHALKASVVVATPREIESLKTSEGVARVELDTPVSIFGSTSIWGLDRIDQRSGRDGQYAIGDEGAGVNVYVIDTGLNLSHSEFTGRVPAGWTGIKDGRGVQDCSGHGTHVAGTVAGTTYGVAKKANIIPVRVLECDGSGWSSSVMAGIDWAISHHVAGQPAVMNLSVGGFTNASFDETVQSAVNDGFAVVAAGGNSGVDACAASPARVPSAITVAATNISDAQVAWSNYGRCVDVQAPGLSVRSAWINSPTAYNTLDGTSMAAPHVSGAAAILLSRDPALAPADVHRSIINNATTGAISASKGATPNRLLFIPAPNPALPPCSNLKLGDAWAGVGLHCGLQGSGAPAASAPESGAAATEAPAVTAIEAPAPAATPDTAAPAPTPDAAETAPTPAPAHLAPAPAPARADAPAPAPAQQIPAASASTRHVPIAGSNGQEMAMAEPAAVSPAAGTDEITNGPGSTPVETPVPAAAVNASAVPALDSSAAISAAGGTIDDAADAKAAAKVNNPVWAVLVGLILAGLAFAYALRRLKSPAVVNITRLVHLPDDGAGVLPGGPR